MARRSKIHGLSGDPSTQWDLFESGTSANQVPASRGMVHERPAVPPAALDDAALIVAIEDAGPQDCTILIDEAVRRKLSAAISAMETLCGRFTGYGRQRAFPEQTAALKGLWQLGGRTAAAAVERLILQRRVEGAALTDALKAAGSLAVKLPADRAAEWLTANDPDLRAAACPFAIPSPLLTPILIELLDDLHPEIMTAAAIALAHQGRAEASQTLSRLLALSPSVEIIEAAALIADEPMLLALEMLALQQANLQKYVIEALDESADPAATVILRRLQAKPLQTSAKT